ncbi:MAG TPA: hypothetical protein VFI13_04195 [Gemmatimonadales bacterium]|nr:hypothetical protein [Gemmatimonadales bacterium]
MRHTPRALPALLLAVAGCGSSDGGGAHPVPGFLTLTLSTPNANDGAVLFKVSGGTIDSVVGGAMVQSGSYVINPTFTRVVTAGNIVDGIIAKIHVPDVDKAASYSATVEQASIRTAPYTQQSLTNYTIAITH